MKKIFILLPACCLLALAGNSQFLKRVGNSIKNKSEQRADQKVDQTIDKGLDKTEESMKTGSTDNTSKTTTPTTTNNTPTNNVKADAPVENTTPALKVYSNYDFVPGQNILFEDNFSDDQDGEFPTHWELKAGQAVLNKNGDEEALYLTDGNYVRVSPRMKTDKYIPDSFTLEYDYYYVPGAYGSLIMLKVRDKLQQGWDAESKLKIDNGGVSFEGAIGNVSLSKEYTEEFKNSFENKWHHVAIAVKDHQMKVYVDQFRILVVPDTKEEFSSFDFAGIGDEKAPIVFRNLRLASGAGMNMIGKKFTDSKIITHGINFDYNKASLKPESMGTLNMIVQVMTDNPDVKFEVGGHTDADGTDAYNLKLSQQRADAVKDQLISLGIDASRLTSKGYGESKPISDNTTPEGKANNRRVEFVKI